jgi:hypothetical protein
MAIRPHRMQLDGRPSPRLLQRGSGEPDLQELRQHRLEVGAPKGPQHVPVVIAAPHAAPLLEAPSHAIGPRLAMNTPAEALLSFLFVPSTLGCSLWGCA